MRELMYIIDEKGGKEAVILPFEEYEKYIKLKKRNFFNKRNILFNEKSEKQREIVRSYIRG